MTEHVALRNSKDLVVEAADALARFDADRIEEIAEWCELVGRNGASVELASLTSSGLEPEGLRREMAVFARVIEATRINLNVLRRLSEIRSSVIEYGGVTEIRYGNN